METETWGSPKDFGISVEKIRKSKTRTSNPTGHSDCMTQLELAYAISDVWQRITGEDRCLDARWVRRLESGDTKVDLRLAECVAEALGATKDERMLLLQAAGYEGTLVVVVGDLGIDLREFAVHTATCIRGLEQGDIPLTEVLHVMKMQRQALSAELSRRLREKNDL